MLDWTWPLARPLIFSFDAEVAHEQTLANLERFGGLMGPLAGLTLGPPPASLARQAFGLTLPGPVGLAAGLDKDGRAIPFWPSLGFGFVEVGTVTAHAQPGNDKPRLFRLLDDEAIINRMGFNNHGSEALALRARVLRDRGRWPAIPVGANVGKSKVTPLEEAPQDYATSILRLQGLFDWFTVNVSSPNTPGLRSLQDPEVLGTLLDAAVQAAHGTPVLLKLAPDLEDHALAEAVELAITRGVSGIIATNTTITRPGLRRDPGEAGGLSGRPLWPLARSRVQVALAAASGRIPVIGCGGVDSPERASELLEAGCTAIQLYTGLIFRGPGLPSQIHRSLARKSV